MDHVWYEDGFWQEIKWKMKVPRLVQAEMNEHYHLTWKASCNGLCGFRIKYIPVSSNRASVQQ